MKGKSMRDKRTTLVADTGGPRARLTDPVTSHRAADGSDLDGSQWVVFHVLEDAGARGATDETIRDRAHRWTGTGMLFRRWSDARLRTARAELVAKGVVVDAGRTAPTSTGYQAKVWMLERFEEDDAA